MPAGAVAGSGVLSAGASLFGADQAAKAQTKAAKIAAATQMMMYDKTRADLAPFRAVGENAGNQLTNRLTELTSPIIMDQAALEQTPGYQFNLAQGLKAQQASAAARGLGLSGAAIKGATSFATGLADSTYQNQFNNANTNQTNAYNRLLQAATLGSNAAAQTGSAGTAAANGASAAQIGAGNAQAGAYMTGANAIGNALTSVGYIPYMNKIMGASGGAGGYFGGSQFGGGGWGGGA